MEKIILILTFLSLPFSTTAQQEKRLHFTDRLYDKEDTIINPYSLKRKSIIKGEESKLDSIYEFYWSTGEFEWIKTYATFHSYNEDKNRINTTMMVWISNPGEWQNNSFQEYYYDDKGNRKKIVIKAWSSSTQEWINHKQRLFSFNEQNNLMSYTDQDWNEAQQSWDNFALFFYNYDELQNWIYYERKDWNTDSLRWELNYRFLFSYENDLKTEMLRQNWNEDDSTWLNNAKNLYSYDVSGNLIEETQFVWQTGSSIWRESTKIQFIRNQSKQVTEKIYQTWITGEWESTHKYTYQYESHGLQSEIVYNIWNGETWVVNNRYLMEYDDTGSLTREIYQKWFTGKGNWVNDYKWEYYSTHFFDPLEAFISDSTNVSCFDYSNGTATVAISGGTPPYTVLWNDPQNTTDLTVFGLSANQYYTVMVTDASLNSVTDSVLLSQPPEIITGQIFGKDIVDQNDTATYWVESDPSSLYSWSVINGQILFNQGGDTIIIVWTGSGQGEVSVIESTPNGCEGDTVHAIISISSTTIRENSSSSLLVYPNPASHVIYVKLEGAEYEKWDIEIYDITGKLVQSVLSLSKTRIQIPLDNIRCGVYFLKIANSSGAVIRKVVVER